MSGSLLLLSKSVIINHIVVYLLYEDRLKFYSTCARFWHMFPQPREYIFGYWFASDTMFHLAYYRKHHEIGYIIYRRGTPDGVVKLGWGNIGGNAPIKSKLDDYLERFGPVGKQQEDRQKLDDRWN